MKPNLNCFIGVNIILFFKMSFNFTESMLAMSHSLNKTRILYNYECKEVIINGENVKLC